MILESVKHCCTGEQCGSWASCNLAIYHVSHKSLAFDPWDSVGGLKQRIFKLNNATSNRLDICGYWYMSMNFDPKIHLMINRFRYY